MKQLTTMLMGALLLLAACSKKDKQKDDIGCAPAPVSCNMPEVYAANETKRTITQGLWGTLAFQEGNCMPVQDPNNTTCRTCPVQRKLRIYPYTMLQHVLPVNGSFYDGFPNSPVATVVPDAQGFFQVALPDGQYSVLAEEDGRLYAFGWDGQGGVSPVTVSGVTKWNLTFNYKATF
ncbi:hypothetical protein [Flaviaesturariibacter amylovorans]|uniref:Carboxypeptidase regulatory-like domain-containing protein n=1 Tax=Flaviaesturariibacter amylovorans TaxID=1084520 RepID=A0ABP8HCQ0_9BACT